MTNREILGTTKVTYKYQITIPKEVRTRYGFKVGDIIVFVRDGDRLYLKGNNES